MADKPKKKEQWQPDENSVDNTMTPDAPWADPVVHVGTDDEGKKKPQTERDIHAGLMAKPHLLPPPDACPHLKDRKACVICRPEPPRPLPDLTATEPETPEEMQQRLVREMQKSWGIRQPEPIRQQEHRYYGPLRHLVGLSRNEILDLMNKTVWVEKKQTVVGTVLKSNDHIKVEIIKLKNEVAEEKKTLKTMNKVDRPDVEWKRREIYKREAWTKIPKLESKILDLEKKLGNWANVEANYDTVEKWIERKVKFRTIFFPEDVQHYENVLALREPERTTTGPTVSRRIVDWEDLVIRLAIFAGLIIPDRDTLERHSSLLLIGNGLHYDSDDGQDLRENELIKKTGGECINAFIQSAGIRLRKGGGIYQRPLESFNWTESRRAAKGGAGPDHGGGGIDSGDYNEPDYE